MFIHTVTSLIANSYVISTEGGVAIVDTGFSNAWRDILRTVDQLGYTPPDVRLIFLTHVHMDHAGSAAELRRQTGAPIAMHRADVGKARAGGHNLPHGRGTAGKILERVVNASSLRFRYTPFEPDILVEDGFMLDEFGTVGKVVYTPGHTLGSVSLELGEGVWIIGDAMINQIRVGMPMYGEDIALAYDSLRKINSQSPRILYSGHGKPFSGMEMARYFEIKGLPVAFENPNS